VSLSEVLLVGLDLHAKIQHFKRQGRGGSRARHDDDVWKLQSEETGVFDDDTGRCPFGSFG